MVFLLLIVALSCFSALTTGGGATCVSEGGVCEDKRQPCAGNNQTGLCTNNAHDDCCLQPQPASCPSIIPRSQWGARLSSQYAGTMPGPAQYVFIHHGESRACHSKAQCINVIQAYQNYHMDDRGWWDIGYNFLVGEDGNAYTARSWTQIGAHTKGYNTVGIAICVMGNFMDHIPNDAALDKVKELIQCGLDLGHIRSDYTLKGHRDVADTDCPGDSFYQLIQSWPHYAPGNQTYVPN